MSDLTDITAVFDTASAASNPITRKPNNVNLQPLDKALVIYCLSLTLTGTSAGCPSGFVLFDTVYKTTHTDSFNFMCTAWAEYNPCCQNPCDGKQIDDRVAEPTPYLRN